MSAIFISDNRDKTAVEAARFLANKYTVYLNDLGGDTPDCCERVSADLSSRADVDQLTASIDVLDAVIYVLPPLVRTSVETLGEDIWTKEFNRGAMSAMNLTASAGNLFVSRGHGTIIYLGSIHCEKPNGCSFTYSLTAASVQMLCREAALDYGAYGVYCYYIQRGVTEQDIDRKNSLSNIYSAPELHYPSKKLPTQDSFNRLIAFLLTDAAAPLNGADLRADSGMTMYYGNQYNSKGGDRR